MRVDNIKYQRIRDLREDMDISQLDMAKTLNVTQNTYGRYELGTRTMPIEVLYKIADYFDTSVDYLIGRTDVKKAYPKSKKHT